jgi:hypothetical protein
MGTTTSIQGTEVEGRTLLKNVEYARHLNLCINQEQLLLSRDLRRGQPEAPTIIPVYHRITGQLDKSVLRKALQALMRRHAALRSSFHYQPALSTDEIRRRLREYARTRIVEPGLYIQKIADEVEIELETRSVTEAALGDLVREELARDFDRETPPRLRATLFELAPDEHRLLIVLDHLVSDGWSVRILERELYSPSDESGMSYAEFAKWQNQANFDRDILYWKGQWERFGDARIGVEDFPFALAAPAGHGFASWQVILDADRSGEVKRFAEQRRVSLFMFFLAIWALVLSRYTGKQRFPVWAHFNNRVRPETHGMIGYLINTHIVGLDLGTGQDLLEQVRRAVLEASAHQEVPLPLCWRALGAAPRFNDAFVMLDVRQGNAARADLPDIVLPRLSKLGVYVTDHQRTLEISMVYSKDAFDADSIRLVGEYFTGVLAEVSASRTS